MRLDRPCNRDDSDLRDGVGPFAVVRLGPFPRGDQQHDVRRRIRAEPGDDLGALLARFAAGQAYLDQATGTEQAGRVETGIQLVPVEITAIGIEYLALADALGTRLRTHRVGRLQHPQHFRPGDQIGRAQRLVGAPGDLLGLKFHRPA